MAFDSNPQAVFHGQGFAEPEEIGSVTFAFTAAASYTVNTFADASLGEVLRSTLEENGLILVRLNLGSPAPISALITASMIPSPASVPDAGGTPADANSLTFNHGSNTIKVGVDADGKLIAGASSATLGTAQFVFYKIK